MIEKNYNIEAKDVKNLSNDVDYINQVLDNFYREKVSFIYKDYGTQTANGSLYYLPFEYDNTSTYNDVGTALIFKIEIYNNLSAYVSICAPKTMYNNKEIFLTILNTQHYGYYTGLTYSNIHLTFN